MYDVAKASIVIWYFKDGNNEQLTLGSARTKFLKMKAQSLTNSETMQLLQQGELPMSDEEDEGVIKVKYFNTMKTWE